MHDLAGVVGHVTVVEFADQLKADAVLVAKLKSLANTHIILNAQTTAIEGDGKTVTGLTYKDRASGEAQTLTLDGVFVQIGLVPNTEIAQLLGCRLDDGFVVVDHRGQTTVPGVYCAGEPTGIGGLDKALAEGAGQLDPVDPSEHRELPQIQHAAASQRELIHGWVGDSAKLHWLFPEPMLDDRHDETYDLLKDYLDWALYRQLRLKHTLSYGPWSEREVLGGVGFLSLNADLERENLAEAEQVLQDLTAQLLKDGLDPAAFARLQNAAIARQAWAVQGNSAMADYYWSALGDYEDGRFANPARELQGVTLETANKAMRELLLQPGYLRIEKPLLSDDQVLWLIAGGLGVLLLILIGWRLHHRRKPAEH